MYKVLKRASQNFDILFVNVCKIAGLVANSVDHDSAGSDLGLHCLFRPVCLNG